MRQLLLLLVPFVAAAAPPAPPRIVEAIDFALDWKKMVGQRVTTVGKFYTADVNHGAMSIPGTFVTVQFAGLPRDTVKYLILNCNHLADAPCRMPVTGTVRPGFFDTPTMTDVTVQLPPSTE